VKILTGGAVVGRSTLALTVDGATAAILTSDHLFAQATLIAGWTFAVRASPVAVDAVVLETDESSVASWTVTNCTFGETVDQMTAVEAE
jgi:hypothetical protein